ncbi:hypothetical protein MMJ09_21975, partial [Bacillus vallismortis]|nr:hypothetical protein [Bacillus vallismortis]
MIISNIEEKHHYKIIDHQKDRFTGMEPCKREHIIIHLDQLPDG